MGGITRCSKIIDYYVCTFTFTPTLTHTHPYPPPAHTHTHTPLPTHTHTHTLTHPPTHTHTHTLTHPHTHPYPPTHTHTHTHTGCWHTSSHGRFTTLHRCSDSIRTLLPHHRCGHLRGQDIRAPTAHLLTGGLLYHGPASVLCVCTHHHPEGIQCGECSFALISTSAVLNII